MISYATALSIVLQQSFDWGTEAVSLATAAGRILRQSIYPDRPQPPFDRVTMDGIAINYISYANGQRAFPVEALLPAGAPPVPLQDHRCCIEIMTGAALPPGVTTVIRYEDLEKTAAGFLLPEGVLDQKNIHSRGSDAMPDQEIMQPGRKIDIAEIGMLATFGYAEVMVSRLPRVAIVATGNELVGVGEQPLDHQIRMSNAHQLAALLASHQIQASLHHLPDELQVMRDQLANILQQNEVVLLSGGVSMGKLDHVPQVLAELGVTQLFHRVAQRPGKPLWVGRTEATMVFGLPGNPVSSLVGFLVYVHPFLEQNLRQISSMPSTAQLTEPLDFKPELTLFQLAKGQIVNGTTLATPVGNAGSGDASSLLRGNGFLQLPSHRSSFDAGEVFPFYSFIHS